MTLNILLIENEINTIEIFKNISNSNDNLIIKSSTEENEIKSFSKNIDEIHLSFISATLPNKCPYKIAQELMSFEPLKNSHFILLIDSNDINDKTRKNIETGIHECLIKYSDKDFQTILKNKISYFKKKNNMLDNNIFTLNELKQEIKYNNEILELTGFEYEALKFFIKNPMKYNTLQEISKSLYSVLKIDISSDSIKNLIYKIRNKIQSSNKYNIEKTYITSKRHFGYKFYPNGIILDKKTN